MDISWTIARELGEPHEIEWLCQRFFFDDSQRECSEHCLMCGWIVTVTVVSVIEITVMLCLHIEKVTQNSTRAKSDSLNRLNAVSALKRKCEHRSQLYLYIVHTL